jgi:hypothetical protein
VEDLQEEIRALREENRALRQASESRAIGFSGPWSLQRRAAVLAVSSALLAGAVWCVVSSHGAPRRGGSDGASARILESPPAATSSATSAAPGVTASNIFDDLSREIAAEGDAPQASRPAAPPAKPPPLNNGSHNRTGLDNGSHNRSHRSHLPQPHINLSRAAELGKHFSTVHNRSYNLSHNLTTMITEQIKAMKNVTAEVENITKSGDWVRRPNKNCYFQHGSGRFPNGSKGDTDANGTLLDLDDCMLACEASEWCDGIVVDAGMPHTKTNGSCSLRSELVFTDCVEDEAFDLWQWGSIDDHVKRLADSYGWVRYKNKNCWDGQGSASFPNNRDAPYSSGDEATPDAISLSECMQRCQEDPLCEAIITSHGKDVSACELRAWVAPDDCIDSEELDLWRMDQGRKVPRGIELPSGKRGLDRLVGVADMITQWSFSKLDFTRCALVGASGVMVGSNAGGDIDGHTAVIRLNRMPTPDFHRDFGARTDVLFLSKEWSGAVAMMGGETPQTSKCTDVPGCPEAAILVRGDLERCDPDHMAYTWGPTHPLVGCTHANVSRMVATGFSTLHGLLATAGLQAFFTFLPVCGELDLYGFGGTSTSDGHIESTEDHNLEEEHKIQDKVINRQWDDLPWRNTFKEFDWIKEHAAQARKVVGTAAA